MPQLIDHLNAMLANNLYIIFLVFARIGTAFMFMPGLGDNFTPIQTRLYLAIGMSVAVAPLVHDQIPPEPQDPTGVAALIAGEMLIGAFIGTLVKMIYSALQTGGMIIAQQIGLSNAYIFSPQMAAQDSLTGTLLGLIAIVVIFATDMHYMMLGALVDSYHMFHSGGALNYQDMAHLVISFVGRSFTLGIELAAPFLIIGLLLFVTFGLLARLMPQIQIFFITLPLQVGLGLIVFSLTLPAIIHFWLSEFQATLTGLNTGDQ